MTTRADVAAEARRWIGTRYAHQQRVRGLACDCGGLIGGIATALGVVPADWWTRVFDPQFSGYSRTPANGILQGICDSFMQQVPIDDMQVGDVIMLAFGNEPHHLAVVADYRHGGLSIVHALNSARAVVEHRLTPSLADKIVAVYRMPGVTA